MDSRFYVSLEAARLLKEKGYDRECIAYYQYEIFHPYSVELFKLSINNKNAAPPYMEQYSAPSKAEAIDWLESKGIIVELSYNDRPHKAFSEWEYFVYAYDKDRWLEAVVCSREENNYYNTILEAEEAAIIKALELL